MRIFTKFLALAAASPFLFSCQQEPLSAEEVFNRYKESLNSIQQIEYNVHRVMKTEGYPPSTSNGYTLMERNPEDTLMNCKVYGKSMDSQREMLYDGTTVYEIHPETKNYEKQPSQNQYGIILSAHGGEAIVLDMIRPDNEHDSVSLTENDSLYLLCLHLPALPEYGITKRTHLLGIDKKDFLPRSIISYNESEIYQSTRETYISDIHVNKQVSNSFDKQMENLSQLEHVVIDHDVWLRKEEDSFTGKTFEEEELRLVGGSDLITIKNGKKRLVEFWVVGCQGCVMSTPKLNELHDKWKSKLDLYGIISSPEKTAQAYIKKHNIQYPNVVCDEEFQKKYNIKSYPCFFLLNEKGIIEKAFIGYKLEMYTYIENWLAEG